MATAAQNHLHWQTATAFMLITNWCLCRPAWINATATAMRQVTTVPRRIITMGIPDGGRSVGFFYYCCVIALLLWWRSGNWVQREILEAKRFAVEFNFNWILVLCLLCHEACLGDLFLICTTWNNCVFVDSLGYLAIAHAPVLPRYFMKLINVLSNKVSIGKGWIMWSSVLWTQNFCMWWCPRMGLQIGVRFFWDRIQLQNCLDFCIFVWWTDWKMCLCYVELFSLCDRFVWIFASFPMKLSSKFAWESQKLENNMT